MQANQYHEAIRYMDNAKENLQKAGKSNGIYADIKYVKTASGVAYNGVLLALDEYLNRKEGDKFTKPKSIEEYKARISKQNKKLLTLLNDAYEGLHILGYYMGSTSVKNITSAFEDAYKIIDYIKEEK